MEIDIAFSQNLDRDWWTLGELSREILVEVNRVPAFVL